MNGLHLNAAVWSLFWPALGACVLPLTSLDRDQDTQKWIRGAMFLTTLGCLLASFFYLTGVWTTGAQPAFEALKLDRLAQFGGIFIVVTAALAVLQCWDHFHQEGWVKGESLSLLLFSVTGMMIFVSTKNLLMLFLGLELLSLPLYALVATLRTRPEGAEGAMKYFLTGAVAAACFLMGAVLLYGMTGSLELDEIARRAAMGQLTADPIFLLGAVLLLMGLLFKVSAAPFHQWTPDAYEASPHPIAGFMSVATKGAALIALMRAFPGALSLAGGALAPKLAEALGILAALTLVIGNLSALVQTNVKRMLAYSSISHAGYLLLGFVAGTPAAMAGVLYYLVIYLAMNMGAFGLLTAYGLVGEATTFDELKGLGWKRPTLGICAVVCMFSLAGIPPFGGFYGKYLIFKELVATGHVSLAILGVLASLVSVYYYLRVIVALFLQSPSAEAERMRSERPEVHAALTGASVLVAAVIVIAGGFAQSQMVARFTEVAVREGLTSLP